LQLIRKQFQYKYGKEFVENAMRNYDGCLNERVVAKLSVEPPAAYLVQRYLERICEQFDVEWTPSMKLTADQMIQPMAAPVGYSVPVAQGTGLGPKVIGDSNNTITVVATPANPDSEMLHPALPTAPRFSTASTTTNIQRPPQPLPPPPPASTSSKSDTNDYFDEPDIFVPGGNPPTATNGGNPAYGRDHQDDDDADPGNPTGKNSGDLSDSYANLAARFEQLNK
jgi:hypothetical protein